MKQHTVLYIPGLGDKSVEARRLMLGLWRYKDISIEVFTSGWQTDESWQLKLKRLLAQIDQLHAEGKIVSLIGESAGASAVTQAFRLRSDTLNAVILLCGKSQYPETVNPRLFRQNPALEEAITGSSEVARSLSDSDRSKLLILSPIYDPVVPVHETRIPGVKSATMPIVGHATSIVFGMTLWSWRIVRFVRLRARTGQ